MYFKTRELWTDLEERFGRSNKARLFQVQKDISCLFQGDIGIASDYTKTKQLRDVIILVEYLDVLVDNVNVESMSNYRITLRSRSLFNF